MLPGTVLNGRQGTEEAGGQAPPIVRISATRMRSSAVATTVEQFGASISANNNALGDQLRGPSPRCQ